MIQAAVGWACAAALDGIAWYVALLFAAVCLLVLLCLLVVEVGCECAAAPDGIKWYIVVLFAAVCWACSDVPDEIAW